jgi:hypothetical protein
MGNADEDSGEDSNEDSEEEADTIIEAVTIPEYATIPSLHDIKSSKPPSPECHYDDAVLQACQQTHESDESKRKTLYILDSLQLSPLVVTDALGMEQNALAHPSVISKLSSGSISVRPIIPTKRKSDGELCPNCSPLVAPGLEHLLAVSPYTAILLKRKYVEIPSSICDLLNEDWTFRPQLRYACAQILAGCIMLNSNNGKAIIANTVEMYGRTRPLDAHREPFGVKKGVPIPTSLPPSTKYSVQGCLAFDDYCFRRREACDRYAIVQRFDYFIVAFGFKRAGNRWRNQPIVYALDYQGLHGDKDLFGRRFN